MMDKCGKIIMEFRNDVLGSYSWTWEGADAEAVFDALREIMLGVVSRIEPTIDDLRKRAEAAKEG